MNLIELEKNIRQWGIDQNITEEGGATIQAQASKGLEEMAELFQTLDQLNNCEWELYGVNAADVDKATKEYNDLCQKLRDDIGDVTVCMIQAARLANTNLKECLEQSWEDIKDRKGKMVNGKFVKDVQ